MLVAHVARLLARLGEGGKVATAEPHQGDQVELLVDIERDERRLELLLDGIVGLLFEHVDLAVVGWIGA